MSATAYSLTRDVVRVVGPDAMAFLQGQLSQDVTALAVGASAFTFVLEPQGKVVVWGRITRLDNDAVAFDVDAGFGERAVTRLNRFKLRTKADIECSTQPVIAIRGDDTILGQPLSVFVAVFDWPGFRGTDLIGAGAVVPPGLAIADADAYERARIAAGVPRLGHELDDKTIPAEGGPLLIDRSVSFTKGCYTGQELVARVDSRGNRTPRRLCRVRIDHGRPAVGATFDDASGVQIGVLTSVAADGPGAVALGYLRRDADPSNTATVAGAPAVVELL